MPTERIPGKPSTRRYTPAEREQAVRLVRQLRKEIGTDQGTVARVAQAARLRRRIGAGLGQPGRHRRWRQGRDEHRGCPARIRELEQEVKELRRANEILRKASAYFAQAELDRPPR